MKIHDSIVIGGGPAGMMTAGTLASLGHSVLLIEKNKILGKKLLITGGGRCNILNAENDTKQLLDKYGKKGRGLFSTFHRFSVESTIQFFKSIGIEIKIEAEKRAFPKTEKAQDVRDALANYLKKHKVSIALDTAVQNIEFDSQTRVKVTTNKGTFHSKTIVIATGGKSHSDTGSSGEAFDWLSRLGHKIEDHDSAMVPIIVEEKWITNLQGLSFQDLKFTAYVDDKKEYSARGKTLFTHFGLSGPCIINNSGKLSELSKAGKVTLSFDFFPDQDIDSLDAELNELIRSNPKKQIKNLLPSFAQPRLSKTVIELTKLNESKLCTEITKEERQSITRHLKGLRLTVKDFFGEEYAIVASGGVNSKEVDFKTMTSKVQPNLYLVGDVLDIERPSGGFSLQICWSSGYVAAKSISEYLKS